MSQSNGQGNAGNNNNNNNNKGNNNNNNNNGNNNNNNGNNNKDQEYASERTTTHTYVTSSFHDNIDQAPTSSSQNSNMYTKSCAPIKLPCTVGSSVIDPCTCRARLECKVNTIDFLYRTCANGTAYDHTTGYCDLDTNIYYGTNGTPICVRERPWERCRSVPNAYSQDSLKQRCEGGGGGGGGGGGSPTNGPQQSGQTDSDDTPAIAGGVVGGIAGLLLIAVLVIVFRKRRCYNSRKSTLPRLPYRSKDSTKKEMEENEEVYDVIDEKAIKSITAHDQNTQGTEYDNLAFKPSEANTAPYSDLNDNEKTTSFYKAGDPSNGYHNKTTSDYDGQNTLTTHDDLSRSVSIGGKDVLIQDSDGYQVGYPSGTLPRQPLPTPPMEDIDLGNENGFEYDVGENPSKFYQSSIQVGKTHF